MHAERKRKSTKAKMLDLSALNESTSANDLQEEINKGHDLTIFSYESIMEATKDFSLENKLGQGGFGPVYKVTLNCSYYALLIIKKRLMYFYLFFSIREYCQQAKKLQ